MSCTLVHPLQYAMWSYLPAAPPTSPLDPLPSGHRHSHSSCRTQCSGTTSTHAHTRTHMHYCPLSLTHSVQAQSALYCHPSLTHSVQAVLTPVSSLQSPLTHTFSSSCVDPSQLSTVTLTHTFSSSCVDPSQLSTVTSHSHIQFKLC